MIYMETLSANLIVWAVGIKINTVKACMCQQATVVDTINIDIVQKISGPLGECVVSLLTVFEKQLNISGVIDRYLP